MQNTDLDLTRGILLEPLYLFEFEVSRAKKSSKEMRLCGRIVGDLTDEYGNGQVRDAHTQRTVCKLDCVL